MTKPQLPPQLSASDAKILNTVFDPESASEAPGVRVDNSLPSDPHITSQAVLSTLRAQEVIAVRLVETCSGDKDATYLKALSILDTIITNNPEYASAWNNRAQLRRWRYGDRGVLTTTRAQSSAQAMEARTAIIGALRDLDEVVALASPKTKDGAVSPAQGKLLAQAWTQRAAIYWGAAKDLSTSGILLISSSWDEAETPKWMAWDKTRFEEEGSQCFFMAGLYGSEVGRAMAVLCNPTAKLCGNIVKEAMRRERYGV